MSMLRCLVIVVGAMLLGMAGAQAQQAAAAKPAKPAKPSAQKTIGLIATMGEELTITTLAKNAISDQERRFGVENWKIADRVAKAVSSQLGKGFKIQRISAPANAFLQLGNPGFFSPNFDRNYVRLVSSIAGAQKADFYLAITPGYSRISAGDQIARGMGVIRAETLLSKKDVVYTLILYRVFDSEFRLVKSEGAFLNKGPLPETIIGPNTVLEGKQRLPTEAYATATDGRTQELLTALLDKDLAATLPKLFPHK